MITNQSIGFYGRFGNMLFQVAAVIGIARKSGQPYGFLPLINHDHKDRFGSSEDVELDKYFVNPLPRLSGDYPQLVKREYPWGYHDIYLPTGNWDLAGHFQSEKYFKHCIEEVRHYFRMKDEQDWSECTALHWRLGDYDDRYHPRQTREYYLAALSHIPNDGTCVVIFSDDKAEAAGLAIYLHEMTGRECSVSVAPSYIDDFRQMKRCRHFITGNSSFSLMAAILGEHPDKMIVCPKNWFGSSWSVPMETADIYPLNSIVI
jgi:hypothetical protein